MNIGQYSKSKSTQFEKKQGSSNEEAVFHIGESSSFEQQIFKDELSSNQFLISLQQQQQQVAPQVKKKVSIIKAKKKVSVLGDSTLITSNSPSLPDYLKHISFQNHQNHYQLQIDPNIGSYCYLQTNTDCYVNGETIQGYVLIDCFKDDAQFKVQGELYLQLKGVLYLGDMIKEALYENNLDSYPFDTVSQSNILQVKPSPTPHQPLSPRQRRSNSRCSKIINHKIKILNEQRNINQKQSLIFLNKQFKLCSIENPVKKGQQVFPFIMKLPDDIISTFVFQENQQTRVQIKYTLKCIVPLVQDQSRIIVVDKLFTESEIPVLKFKKEIEILELRRNKEKGIANKNKFKEDFKKDSLMVSSGAVPSLNYDSTQVRQQQSDSIVSSPSKKSKKNKIPTKISLAFTYDSATYQQLGIFQYLKKCCLGENQILKKNKNQSLSDQSTNLNYKVLLKIDKTKYYNNDTIQASVVIDIFPNLFTNQKNPKMKVKLQSVSCALKMLTTFKNIESQKTFKSYCYDLFFKTEDMQQEVQFNASKGSYQQYIRHFNFNLEEIFQFVGQSGKNKSSESSFASVFSQSQQNNWSRASQSNKLNKSFTKLVDQLKQLKEVSLYSVENEWIENKFFIEVILDFEKGHFGLSNTRSLSIPVNIFKKRKLLQGILPADKQPLWNLMPEFYHPIEQRLSYLVIENDQDDNYQF